MADVINLVVNAELSDVISAKKKVKDLGAALASTYDKIQQQAKAFQMLDKAFNSGGISAQQYARMSRRLNQEETRLNASVSTTTGAIARQSATVASAVPAQRNLERQVRRTAGAQSNAAVAARNLSNAQRMAGKSTNKFGMVSQQVGYQVGDFFVQVQSGTDALVAFGQQGTQLAGLMPGIYGAVVGIGLSLGTALLRASLEAKNLEINFKAVASEFGKALEPLRPMIDALGKALSRLNRDVSKVFAAMADNFARIIAYVTSLITLLGIKLIASFVLSGGAAKAFFKIIRMGLIGTGVGAIVVLFGELLLVVNDALKKTGNLGDALISTWDKVHHVMVNVKDALILEFKLLVLAAKAKFWEIVSNLFYAGMSMEDAMGFTAARIRGVFVGLVRAIFVLFTDLTPAISGLFEKLALNIVLKVQKLVQGIMDGLNAVRKFADLPEIPKDDFLKWTPDPEEQAILDKKLLKEAKALGTKARNAYLAGVQAVKDQETHGIAGPEDYTVSEKEMFKLLEIVRSLETEYDTLETSGVRLKELLSSLFVNVPGMDTSDFFKGDTGKGLDKLTEEIASIRMAQREEETLIGLRDEKLMQMKLEGQLRKAMDDEYNASFDQFITLVAKDLAANQKRLEMLKEVEDMHKKVGQTIASSFDSNFMSIIEGTKSVAQAFKDMAYDIVKHLYRVLVIQTMVRAFGGYVSAGATEGSFMSDVGGALQDFKAAKGGVLNKGQVVPYADGGIVGSPTTFPMTAGRTGLMGEAGPEAIMPLKRGKNGKLGVETSGGSGGITIHQNFNFTANGDESVKQIIAQQAPAIANMTKRSILDDRRRGGQMKQAFG